MGFSEIILIGFDHNFDPSTKPLSEVTIKNNDDFHFSSGYHSSGFTYLHPDPKHIEECFLLAREAFEQEGKRILDATVDGKLSVIPKISYHSLFVEGDRTSG